MLLIVMVILYSYFILMPKVREQDVIKELEELRIAAHKLKSESFDFMEKAAEYARKNEILKEEK